MRVQDRRVLFLTPECIDSVVTFAEMALVAKPKELGS